MLEKDENNYSEGFIPSQNSGEIIHTNTTDNSNPFESKKVKSKLIKTKYRYYSKNLKQNQQLWQIFYKMMQKISEKKRNLM